MQQRNVFQGLCLYIAHWSLSFVSDCLRAHSATFRHIPPLITYVTQAYSVRQKIMHVMDWAEHRSLPQELRRQVQVRQWVVVRTLDGCA